MQTRSLSKGELPVPSKLLTELNLTKYFPGDCVLNGADPILRTPHKLGEAVSYVLALDAIAAASIWKLRTNLDNDIDINILDAIHFLHPTHYIWQNGYKLELGAETVPTNGLFKCKDNKYVMIQSGPPYRKLEHGYLNFLNCGNNREAIGKVISNWDSFELQEKLNQLGLPCCIANTKEEWEKHHHGSLLTKTPTIEIEKIADGDPYTFTKAAKSPLDNIKVLDFTHVLAGPRSTFSLAEFGADILHISSPYERDTLVQNLAVNAGKRNAYLDLTKKDDLEQLKKLLTETDVFANSYRPSVVERFGITPHQSAQLSKKGLIYSSINTYGHSGPWADRPGFDQLGQVTSGFAITEGGESGPRFSPVFYLNDLISAYLSVAGVIAALIKRSEEGGSYHVKVSLAKSAMWVQGLGYIDKKLYEPLPTQDNYDAKLVDEESPYGRLTRLAQPTAYTNMPKIKLKPVVPYGADEPKW